MYLSIPLNTGVKVSSGGTGNVKVDIAGSSIIGNLDDGAQLESEGTGLLTVRITDTTISDSPRRMISRLNRILPLPSAHLKLVAVQLMELAFVPKT